MLPERSDERPSGEATSPARRAVYVREVLRLYLATPTVHGHVRGADRHFAAVLFDRDVPLYVIESALLVAAARRVLNNAYATDPPPIRSLHYFAAIINEMIDRPLGYRDLDDLRDRLRATLGR
jgi:hypothetical protein